LSKTQRCITIQTVTIVLFGSTSTTALCTCTILVSALIAEVALLSNLYCLGIFLGKLQNIAVTLAVVFGHGTQYDSSHLYRNTPVPLLWRCWLLTKMGVPHLFQSFVGKRCSSCQQFIAADRESVLIRIAAWIALPLFRRHISGCPRRFTK